MAERRKGCFVIGPMGPNDTDRLHHLAYRVIQPLLETLRPGEYVVKTPDLPEIGQVMSQVIRELDRCELVVADVTLDRPSVFYELAIRHCLGRAYVMVRDESRQQGSDASIAFDVRDYRYWNVDLSVDAVESARAHLMEVLPKLLDLIDSDAPPEELGGSPAVRYYGAPLTEVSAGAGLAYGYYYNFVKPTAQGLDTQKLTWPEDNRPFADDWWSDVKLHIFLPESLDQANRRSIGALMGSLKRVQIPTGDRPIGSFAFPWQQGCGKTLRIVDIPTTMAAIEESVRYRAGTPNPNLDEYPSTWLAWQEFRRFRNVFKRLWTGYRDSEIRKMVQEYTCIEKAFDLESRIKAKNWRVEPH